MPKHELVALVLVLWLCCVGRVSAQNTFHFGIRLETSVVQDRPQWQSSLLGVQGGLAFHVGSDELILGLRGSITFNPETLRFRWAIDVFTHTALESSFLYLGAGYANSRIAAATYSDLHGLVGMQLPLGIFFEYTLGLGWTEALDFSVFPPKIVNIRGFLTMTLVFGWWVR